MRLTAKIQEFFAHKTEAPLTRSFVYLGTEKVVMRWNDAQGTPVREIIARIERMPNGTYCAIDTEQFCVPCYTPLPLLTQPLDCIREERYLPSIRIDHE
jgi:hypothetical protein